MVTEIKAGPYKKLFTKVKTLKDRLEKVLSTPGFDVNEVTQLRENIEFFEDKLQEQRKRKEERRQETYKKIQDAKDVMKPEEASVEKPAEKTAEEPAGEPAGEPAENSVVETYNDSPVEVNDSSSVGRESDITVEAPQSTSIDVPVEAATEKEADTNKLAFNDLVEPIAGTPGSLGRVINHNVDQDEVYVEWMDGKLKERDGFGAYKGADLKKVASKKKADIPEDLAEEDYEADNKFLPKGTKVTVTPTAPGIKSSYPAADWIKESTQVELLEDAPYSGTLDVLDVRLPDGTTEYIYDFNIDGPVEEKASEALFPGEKKLREEREKRYQEKKKKLLPREELYEPKKDSSIRLSKYDKEGTAMKKRSGLYFQDLNEAVQQDIISNVASYLKTTDVEEIDHFINVHNNTQDITKMLESSDLDVLDKEAEGTENLKVIEQTPVTHTDPSERATGYGDISHAPKTEETSITADSSEEIPLTVFNKTWTAKKTSGKPGVPNAYAIFDDKGQLALAIKLKDETKDLNKNQLEEILFNEYGKRQLVLATLKYDARPLRTGDSVLVAGYDRKTKKIKALNKEDKKFIGWAPRKIFNFDLDPKVHKTLSELAPKKSAIKLSKLDADADVNEKFQVGDRVYSDKKGDGTVTYSSRGYVSVQWDNPVEQMLGPEPVRPDQLKDIKKKDSDVDKEAQPRSRPPRPADPGYEWVLVDDEWYQKPIGQR